MISRALSVWGLDLVPRDSSDPAAVRAKSSPIAANAYICNYRCPLPTLVFFHPTWWNQLQGALVCHQETWKSVVQSQLTPGGPWVGEGWKLWPQPIVRLGEQLLPGRVPCSAAAGGLQHILSHRNSPWVRCRLGLTSGACSPISSAATSQWCC